MLPLDSMDVGRGQGGRRMVWPTPGASELSPGPRLSLRTKKPGQRGAGLFETPRGQPGVGAQAPHLG